MSRLSRDFWTFWAGQSLSAFGSSITQFALPLLVFRLTGSAVDLGLAVVAFALPYMLFGLLIGAWTDRLDRKRVMILADLGRAVVIGSIPLAAALGVLSIWWIYAVLFVSSTLGIFFDASQFGAIPSLVARDDLVTANGRIQASFSAASVVGPFVGGALLAVVPVAGVVTLDAASFVVSAVSVALIRRSFHAARTSARRDIRADIVEGLRYVLRHPVLRNISAMMVLVNFLSTTTFAQLVLFAKVRFEASDSEVGFLFAAGGLGVVLLSLAAGPLRRRWSFGTVALGALMLSGMLTIAIAVVPWYAAVLVFWALSAGLGALFNINTASLRQSFVPEHLLGRIISVAMVLAWSANPPGALLGAYAIERTGDVALVYGVIGALTFAIAFAFYAFSPLGRAERYLAPAAEPAS